MFFFSFLHAKKNIFLFYMLKSMLNIPEGNSGFLKMVYHIAEKSQKFHVQLRFQFTSLKTQI